MPHHHYTTEGGRIQVKKRFFNNIKGFRALMTEFYCSVVDFVDFESRDFLG